MYDLAVIGAGPAGLSAAITARNRNKEVLIISNKPSESLLAKAHKISNYPGMPNISGSALLEEMVGQAKDMGVNFVFERVTTIAPTGKYFSISTNKDAFEAQAVILAVGKNAVKPIEGESDFIGRGVSHCATCDGMFYKNTDVVVVGLSTEAPKEANFLSEIASSVTYISPKPAEGLNKDINVMIGKAVEIKGDMMGVTELVFTNSESNETESVFCAGVFILRPSIAPSMLIAGLEVKDDHIVIDEKMQTKIPGVFAAGDCLGKPDQIAKAVGQGHLASHYATEYLDSVKQS